jgi:hypothetical protein
VQSYTKISVRGKNGGIDFADTVDTKSLGAAWWAEKNGASGSSHCFEF